jgi:O-antigen/teichoic acid export membrane protein
MNEVDTKVAPQTGISISSKFAKNWAYLLTSSVFYQALGMVAMIRVARILTPAGYGHYNLVQATASIGMIFAGLGMREVIIRACARNPENSRTLYSTSLRVRFVFGFLVALGILLYSLLSPNTLPTSLSGFVIMILFGQILWDTSESISFGKERMEFSSWINSLGSFLWVIWVWCVPASMLTVAVVSLSSALLQLFKAGVLRWQVTGIIPAYRSDERNTRKDTRHLVRESLPFYWLALMSMAQGEFSVLILAGRSNSEQVGLFNVGFRLLRPLAIFIATGLSVLYPYLSRAKIQDTAEYMQAINKAFKTIIVMGSSCAFLVSLLRTEVVQILFGAKYAGSSDAIAFQCWNAVLYAILCLIGTSLAASDKQRWLAALSTACTIIALPIIWFGTPFGATGLAIGMVIGSAMNLTYHWYFFRKSLPGKIQSRVTIRYFIVFGIAFLCSWITPINTPVPIKIFISCIIIFAVSIYLTKQWRWIRPIRI